MPIANSSNSPDEQVWMRRALELAEQGTALASPNPRVGAVLVRERRVVGEGYYTYEDRRHAEIRAIEQAGQAARGAALYINLEPCCHTGRTGPCTEAIVAARVARVVAAMPDPNPQVAGRGFERLRQAGVEIEVGLCREEAEKLNESFARYIRNSLPFVTLKAAMTLDGKIAAPDDNSGWITSEQARAYVQQQRHAHDAILTGIGTIMADDPLLTDRCGRPRRRPLLRVVMDSRLRIPLSARMLQEVRNDLLIICSSSADEEKRKEMERRGAEVYVLPGEERPDLLEALRELGRREITSVLLEAGAELNWAALEAALVDKVFLYYAPKILGGHDSLPLVGGPGFRAMRAAREIRRTRMHQFGEDFAIEGYLHDVYRDH
ncbi:MAG: bifunctional diaminohydroxyphosphoribosylaminopyrimidine deaminase/5-amino-6-(5-phosphoribosylamino)uracil reductase RibD [Acidobacteria bacterium]|nr:bifunctional diaminohydroxyphosphoribosylaminopyrimidine deaminase/5-amino-6-(5-phosphoribosylamino)uracil reductase RibD [Acidobacteriota bacterium]